MKDYFVLGLVVGLGIGLAFGSITANRRASDPTKVINWEPANRFEMHVDGNGYVWRLDRATGTMHVAYGNRSFDIPEYSNDEP